MGETVVLFCRGLACLLGLETETGYWLLESLSC